MTEALRALGWDDAWESRIEGLSPSRGEPARVTAQHRDRWSIQTGAGARNARRVGSGRDGPTPVTGDWVMAAPGPETSDPWTILTVLPRRTAVLRGAAGPTQSPQVLAANVDRLWIVQALDTPPNLRSLERYLAVAWESGATPEVVLTKSDLAEDLAGALEAVRAVAFGVTIHAVSVTDASALDALRSTLVPGRTVALLGPSGAGKSTLINQLAQGDLTRVGEVREGDRKGRHTTTGRELFPIHGGALLLDTPGMRELKVLDVAEGLEHTFPEIDGLAAACRFRDCTHMSEPGCAVLAALEEGRLAPERLESFRKLQAEAAYERRRSDPRAQAAHVAEHKTALKTVKVHPKYRDRD